MKRYIAAAIIVLLGLGNALAQPRWAQFMESIPAGGGGAGPPACPGGPPCTIAIDGGPTYAATNGLTTASKSWTFCSTTPFPACTGTTYANGWDSPNFFAMGWALEFIANGQTDINKWLASYSNFATAGLAAPASGQLDLLLHNGITSFAGGEQFAQQIANDRAYGDETTGVFTWDEPQTGYESTWVAWLQGYPSATFSAYAGAGFSASQSNCVMTASSFTYGNIDSTNQAQLSGGGFTTETISFFSGTGGLGTYPLSAVSTAGPTTITGGTSGAHATGSIACNILTLSSALTGTFVNGETITGTGVTGGTVLSFGTGTGIAGTYQGSVSQTLSGTVSTNSYQAHITSALTPSTTPVIMTYPVTSTGQLQNYPFWSGTGITPNTVWPWTSNLLSTGPDTYTFSFGNPVVGFAPTTVTQAAMPGFGSTGFQTGSMDTRLNTENFTNVYVSFKTQHGTLCPSGAGCVGGGSHDYPATFIAQNAVTSPGGHTRHMDFSTIDYYWFVLSQCQNVFGSNCSTTQSNIYNCCTVDNGYTLAQGAKGTHYGDVQDMIRAFNATNADGSAQRMTSNFLETGQCICGVMYDIQPSEIQWGVWGQVLHGGRMIQYFGQNGGLAMNGCTGGEQGDTIYCSYLNTVQSVTMPGASISGGLLTVPQTPTGNGQAGGGQVSPGMWATSGVTGASQILQQTIYGSNGDLASFTATFSGTNNVTMTTSGVTGTIKIPSMLTGLGVGFTAGTDCFTNPYIRAFVSGINGGAGVYTVDADSVNCPRSTAPTNPVSATPVASFTATFTTTTNPNDTMQACSISGNIDVPSALIGANLQNRGQTYQGGTPIIRSLLSTGVCNSYRVDTNNAGNGQAQSLASPGGIGTYAVRGGSGSGTFVYQQRGWGYDATLCPFCGAGPSVATGTSNMGGVTAVNKFVQSMAPVINSPFVKGYLTAQTPDRYMFERGMTQACGTGVANVNMYTKTCGTSSGLDSMVKYFNGPTFTASTGDSITPGFYLFATTGEPETVVNQSASFSLFGGCGLTTATPIGEARSPLTISGCSFSDTFGNAWTTHIYKLQ